MAGYIEIYYADIQVGRQDDDTDSDRQVIQMTKKVMVGDVQIGGGAPVSIQSMSNIDTRNVKEVLEQIETMNDAGCQIMRLAVNSMEACDAFAEIKKKSPMPLVADIHFDYRLAIGAIRAGADKIRINPGNIGGRDKVRAVVDAAKERNIPIRVGVNSGSLEKEIMERDGRVTCEGLVESALQSVKIIEDMDYDNLVISVKSSDPVLNYRSYMLLSQKTGYPLHIGVTEAGTVERGKIKSAVGLGALLLAGVGDTMRVSLTGDPVNEISVAKSILASAGMYREPVNLISCPTCGRTGVDLASMVDKIDRALVKAGTVREKKGLEPLTVAVMGCEVNGPGEASGADLGVACGRGKGVLFVKGKIVETLKEEEISDRLIEMVENYEKYI